MTRFTIFIVTMVLMSNIAFAGHGSPPPTAPDWVFKDEGQTRKDLITKTEADSGYYVIVASTPIPDASTAAADANVRSGIISQAARCGLKIYNDFSFKFGSRFRPGYVVYALGDGISFGTKQFALENLRKARPCFPHAYIKYGYRPGE